MSAQPRRKGKRVELLVAAELRALGFTGSRRGQQRAGGPESPDIADAIDGCHIEVKGGDGASMHAALRQSQRDSRGALVPLVLIRRDRKPTLAVCELSRLPDVADAVTATLDRLQDERAGLGPLGGTPLEARVAELERKLAAVAALDGLCLLGPDSPHTGENPPRQYEAGAAAAFAQAAGIARSVTP